MRLKGKSAIVTGAASGIGRATAIALAREGAAVMLTDIDDEGGHATLAAIARAGGKAAYPSTVLMNVNNIAWFGDTVAIDQHRNISRLRALELQRPMVRATNTGATAAIDHLGRVTHELPRLTRGTLDATVQGRDGATPFARWAGRWGLWPLVLAALLALAWAARRARIAAR